MMLRITLMMVTRKPGGQGERVYAVEPLRGEGRDAPAEPVCSCAAFCLMHRAHETAGAARPRLFPAPSSLKRRKRICKTRAKCCRENDASYPVVIARSE